MYNKNDKRRLYWLMEQYLSGKISERFFCDEFYYSYDLELNYDDLSSLEKNCFSELNKVTSRFSEFEEDHKLDTKAFFSKSDLEGAIRFTYKRLKGNSRDKIE